MQCFTSHLLISSDSALEAGHEVLFASIDPSDSSPYVAVPYSSETELRRLLDIPLAGSDAVIRRSSGMTIEGEVRRRRARAVIGP